MITGKIKKLLSNMKYLSALTTLCLLCTLLPALYAVAEDMEDPVYDLPTFLSETGLNFKQYIDITNEFKQEGIYTFYIEEYDAGYTWFDQNNPDIPYDAAIAYVNVGLDAGAYTKIKAVPDVYNVSLLVNQNHALPENWEPEDLTNIPGEWQKLRAEAGEHYALMRDAIRENKLNLYIVSAFRSYSTQRRLHRDAISSSGLTGGDMAVAREGHSEHQSGLAVDILHRSHGGRLSNANFQDTAEYTWLLANAHKYGFIQRYPDEYSEILGYMYEPWHWRFVGVDVATAMKNEGIVVYEEFYGKYLAPEVLMNTKELIDARALAAQQELERLEREAAEKAAAEEAAAAAALEQASKEQEEPQSVNAGPIVPVLDTDTPKQQDLFFDNTFTLISILLLVAFIVTVIETFVISSDKHPSKLFTRETIL